MSVQESQLNNQIEAEITAPEETYKDLATIRKIKTLSPIEGADRIELATMEDLSWQVVVQKGLHKVEDLICYIQIDTVCPEKPWAEFLRARHFRVKTIKLQKTLSQGLIIPLKDVVQIFFTGGGYTPSEQEQALVVGADITTQIGVIKYEKPIPANLRGTVRSTFPSSIVPKTDEERIQNYPRLVEDINGLECYISIKMDGTSATYIHNNGDTLVCSRNMSLKQPGSEDKQNVYWDMEKKYDILNKLKDRQLNIAIQGEICGTGVQGNKMGLSEVKLLVFNVYDINTQKFFSYDNFIQFCQGLGLDIVPILGKTTFNNVSVPDLLTLAEGNYDNGTPREGIVIRPVVETTSHAMRDGRLSFKVINNTFLLKYGE